MKSRTSKLFRDELARLPDNKGRLFAAAFGSIAACFVLPFWVAFRGKLSFLLVFILSVLGITGLIFLNSWVCVMAGTKYVHPNDHVQLLLFCVPREIAILCKRNQTRNLYS